MGNNPIYPYSEGPSRLWLDDTTGGQQRKEGAQRRKWPTFVEVCAAMTSLEDALADCLEATRKGETHLAACIERYPQYRDELAATLRVAARLQRLSKATQPSPAWRRRTMTALRAKMQSWESRGLARGA